MQPTPIKINKSPNDQNEPPKNILNLNVSPAKPLPKNHLKKYLWPLLILVVVQSLTIAWLYLLKPISPYFKLLPRNTIVSSYFNQNRLIELLKNDPANWPPITWGSGELKTWLAKTKIEQPQQILKLFDDQMALTINPSATWLILATIKVPDKVFQQARETAEQSLKQNYNLVNESYRQVAITQVKPLDQKQGSIFYGQARGYFILANNSNVIKETVDKIIR